MPTNLQSHKNTAQADKFLTFCLDKQSYAIGVPKVREIIRQMKITPIPQMPKYIKGVINLRGKVLTLVDLRTKFKLPHAEATDSTCTIIVQANLPSGGHILMGLVVDAVEEVANIPLQDIENNPDFGVHHSAACILGMAKVRGTVTILLDVDRIISSETVELMTNIKN